MTPRFRALRAFLHPPARPPAASEGPLVEQRASCAYFSEEPGQKQSNNKAATKRRLALAADLASALSAFHRVRATMARCSTGAPVRRWVGVDRPAGASAWMPMPFRQDRSPVEKPGPDSRTCRAGCPASAKRGGLSLWL